jgi:NAD(P)H-flavin reductase
VNAAATGVLVTVPAVAEVVEAVAETPTIATLRARLLDPDLHAAYRFASGQFNMLSVPGVGEVPISIVSDPGDAQLFDHTLRAVGRVSGALARLRAGDHFGLRGPFGRGWPLDAAEGRDVVIISGGLGCAPTVSVINYVMRRRARFGRLTIVQGVKHSNDLLWRQRYEEWAGAPHTQVLIAADVGVQLWPWHVGRITDLFDRIALDPARALAMLCGPEGMMRVAVDHLLARGLAADAVWLSMERSMHCALGSCGHCQLGPKFVCRDGPVFCYNDIREWFGRPGL